MYEVINIAVILMLMMGAVVGFKRGIIKSTVMFVGTILVFVLAYLLKNPVANIFYTIFPFVDFGENYSVLLNIILYEGIAFLLIVAILFVLLNLLIKCSSAIEKVLKATIILGIPSKLLGMVLGVLEFYVLVFFSLYVLKSPVLNLDLTSNSKTANVILTKTPVLSKMFDKNIKVDNDLNLLKSDFKNKNDNNLKAMDIMLKTKIITVKSVDILIKKDKLDIPGVEKVIDKYRGE